MNQNLVKHRFVPRVSVSPLKMQLAVEFVMLFEYLRQLMGKEEALRDPRLQAARREYMKW